MSEVKDTMELCGNIAYFAKAQEWKQIEKLIDETKLAAFKAGMTRAATVFGDVPCDVDEAETRLTKIHNWWKKSKEYIEHDRDNLKEIPG